MLETNDKPDSARSLGRARHLLLMLLLGLCGAVEARAGVTSLVMASDPGDWVGKGDDYYFTLADGAFYPTHYAPNAVMITFYSAVSDDVWSLILQAPSGQILAPGSYQGAIRDTINDPSKPGLDVGGGPSAAGHGCDDTTGSFDVIEAVYGETDEVLAFRARFEQYCDGLLSPLRGEIRINADVSVEMSAPRRAGVVAGEHLHVALTGAAYDGAPPLMAAGGLPDGAVFTDAGDGNGVLDWTPDQDQVGSHVVTFTGADSSGNAESVSTNILVGKTIHVPSDFASVQSAIAGAPAASRIVVAPGTYQENLDFLGKPLIVESEAGPDATILDGGHLRPVIVFYRDEGRDSVLRGFTVRNGWSGFDLPWFGTGGGIYVARSAPSILDNVITGNFACEGTGIGVFWGEPLISNNVIRDNGYGPCTTSDGAISLRSEGHRAEIVDNVITGHHQDDGGGIYAVDPGAPLIQGNVIRDNVASRGGGIEISGTSAGTEVIENLIVGNQADRGGGIEWGLPAGRLLHNTIVDNDARIGSAVHVYAATRGDDFSNNVFVGKQGQPALHCEEIPIGYTYAALWHNDIFSPGADPYSGPCTDPVTGDINFSAAPDFACGTLGDFRPDRSSPLVDAGDSLISGIPATDLSGSARFVDGDGDGAPTVDIGAYEFDPTVAMGPCSYISCPADVQSVAPRGQTSARVEYAPPATIAGVTSSCTPASGADFVGGKTQVTCTGSDPWGHSDTCKFQVSVLTPPLNDEFADATMIAALPFSESLGTADATMSPQDPACTGPAGSVWYAYTPVEDSILTVDTAGSSYNPTVSAFAANDAGGISNDACGRDRIDFKVFKGRTVYLQAGSEVGGGHLILNVTSRPLLKIQLALDRRGTLLPSGEAVLRGSVACSRPTPVAASGEIDLGRRRATIVRKFSFDVLCDGMTAWEVTLPGIGDEASVRRTIVTVSADAVSSSPPESSAAHASAGVQLRPPAPKSHF